MRSPACDSFSVIPGMRTVGERRGLQRLGEAHRQLDAVRFANRELTLEVRFVVAKPRVPECHAVAPARDVGGPNASAVRAAEERRVGDYQVRHHVVMDVAAEGYHARLIEGHGRVWVAMVERQLEALGGREGIDLMAD